MNIQIISSQCLLNSESFTDGMLPVAGHPGLPREPSWRIKHKDANKEIGNSTYVTIQHLAFDRDERTKPGLAVQVVRPGRVREGWDRNSKVDGNIEVSQGRPNAPVSWHGWRKASINRDTRRSGTLIAGEMKGKMGG